MLFPLPKGIAARQIHAGFPGRLFGTFPSNMEPLRKLDYREQRDGIQQTSWSLLLATSIISIT